MKTQREKFECWFKSKWRKHALTLNYDLTYVDDVVQDAWVIWCAAIESVVVELPSPSSAVDYGYELNDIQSLLTDAGIRYE